jgi:hypothetical protein
MVDHSPWFFGRVADFKHPKLPIPEGEAQEVFERMDKRFRDWTGKSLAEHIAAISTANTSRPMTAQAEDTSVNPS